MAGNERITALKTRRHPSDSHARSTDQPRYGDPRAVHPLVFHAAGRRRFFIFRRMTGNERLLFLFLGAELQLDGCMQSLQQQAF